MKTTTLLLATFALLPLAGKAAPQQPNIVFLLADALGDGDLHCYGHPYSRTPNIDTLTRDGTRFAQFYATGTTCCPARTGLMTSKFPATSPTYPANGGFVDRVTITELLKKAGYATGHFGKWHLGPERKPGTYGIDVIGGEPEEGGGRREAGKRTAPNNAVATPTSTIRRSVLSRPTRIALSMSTFGAISRTIGWIRFSRSWTAGAVSRSGRRISLSRCEPSSPRSGRPAVT